MPVAINMLPDLFENDLRISREITRECSAEIEDGSHKSQTGKNDARQGIIFCERFKAIVSFRRLPVGHGLAVHTPAVAERAGPDRQAVWLRADQEPHYPEPDRR